MQVLSLFPKRAAIGYLLLICQSMEVKDMPYDELTKLDCIALFEFKGIYTVLENGRVTGFVDGSNKEVNIGEEITII